MALFSFVQSVGAGATYRPLDGWQYQQVPAGGRIQLLVSADAVGCLLTVVAGSDQLVQRCPVSAGATAGVLPTPFNTPVIEDLVAALDPIDVSIDNPTGGAIDVVGVIDYQPA